MVFAIHWLESAMGVHVFPILNPPSRHSYPCVTQITTQICRREVSSQIWESWIFQLVLIGSKNESAHALLYPRIYSAQDDAHTSKKGTRSVVRVLPLTEYAIQVHVLVCDSLWPAIINLLRSVVNNLTGRLKAPSLAPAFCSFHLGPPRSSAFVHLLFPAVSWVQSAEQSGSMCLVNWSVIPSSETPFQHDHCFTEVVWMMC